MTQDQNSVSICVNTVLYPGQITVGNELGINDCDDTYSSINPSAPDDTCDSIDNNCNLYVDENTAPCFAPSVTIPYYGLTQVELSWEYPSPSSNVENFVIEKSPNGITFTVLKVLPNTVTSYTDSTYLTQRYYYKVYAKNVTGIGPKSSVAYVPFVATGLFEKTVGGTSSDFAYLVIEADGGFVVAGHTHSFGAGLADIYVVKLDQSGNVEWTKTIGRSSHDYAMSVIQTSDGGYVVVGYTESFGAGGSDIYVVKLDLGGNIKWTKAIGGAGDDRALSVTRGSDGSEEETKLRN